jgi:hypothetical protein
MRIAPAAMLTVIVMVAVVFVIAAIFVLVPTLVLAVVLVVATVMILAAVLGRSVDREGSGERQKKHTCQCVFHLDSLLGLVGADSSGWAVPCLVGCCEAARSASTK